MKPFIKQLKALIDSSQKELSYADLEEVQELIKELNDKNEDALNDGFELLCNEKMKQRGKVLGWEPTIQKFEEKWVWAANPVFEFKVDFDDEYDDRCGSGMSDSIEVAENECREFITKFANDALEQKIKTG